MIEPHYQVPICLKFCLCASLMSHTTNVHKEFSVYVNTSGANNLLMLKVCCLYMLRH